MKKELDDALVKDFPNLYMDRACNPKHSSMCFGFECDNGWYTLLRKMSKKLEEEILKQPEERRKLYRAVRVKEKFGELRFSMSGYTEEMFKIIDEAYEESSKTCQVCGKPGETKNNHGWLTTLCLECLAQGNFPNKS